MTDDTRARYKEGVLDGASTFSLTVGGSPWVRGNEDDENSGNRIVMTRLGGRRPPVVLTDDRHW